MGRTICHKWTLCLRSALSQSRLILKKLRLHILARYSSEDADFFRVPTLHGMRDAVANRSVRQPWKVASQSPRRHLRALYPLPAACLRADELPGFGAEACSISKAERISALLNGRVSPQPQI